MARTIVVLLITANLLIVIGSSATMAVDEKPSEAAPIDFRGKIVMLGVRGSSVLESQGDAEYLTEAVIQEVGDRFFVTGKAYTFKELTDSADTESDWREGAQMGVAWDQVQRFYVYTPEQFEKAKAALFPEDDE